MAVLISRWDRQQRQLRLQRQNIGFFSSRRKLWRFLLISLVVIAILPPLYLHFHLRHLHQIHLRKCSWIRSPPLVCAHGGDSSQAFPNTMYAFKVALRSQVDCIEIDVSRSSDGVLFALHDRELQRLTQNSTSKAGYLSMTEISKLGFRRGMLNLQDINIPTLEDALKLVSGSVRQVILDAKVGPPLYEKGLAKDILSVVFSPRTSEIGVLFIKALDKEGIWGEWNFKSFVPQEKVERTKCKNCVVWAKSDNLARDTIKLSTDTMVKAGYKFAPPILHSFPVGYIVMIDPSTGNRTKLLRMKDAGVVGVYHPLIDEELVKTLHESNKKVYAWTVDEEESMERMLLERVDAVVTSKPTLLQRVMRDSKTECFEEGLDS